LNLKSLLWSCSAEDWRLTSDVEATARADELTTLIRGRDILLFHDEKLTTVTLLRRLLPALQARGLRFDLDLEQAT
jgi:hypothetical protein